jgi:chitinase
MQHLLALSAFSLTLSSVLAGPTCALVPPKAALVQNDPGPGAQGSDSNDDSLVAAGWYPGWHADQYPPSNITWSGYTDVKYAFASVVFHLFVRLTDDEFQQGYYPV